MINLNIFRKYIKRYGRFKIKNTLVLTFIIVVSILTLLILFLSSNFFKNVMSNSLIESTKDNLLKSVEMIDIKLQNIYQISYGISNDSRVKEIISNQSISSGMPTEEQNELRKLLLNYCKVSEYIYSVNAFKKDYNKTQNRFKIKHLEETIGYGMNNYSLYTDFMANRKNKLYSYKENVNFNQYYNPFLEISTISTFQPIYEYNGQKEIGTLNINIRAEYLFSHMSRIGDKYYSRVYIIDNNGNEIYYNNLKKSNEKIEAAQFLKDILRKKTGWIKKNFNGSDYIVVFNTIGTIGWIVVDIIPYDEIIKDFNNIQNKIILLSLIINAIVIILYLLIASNIVRPLHRMVKSLKKMQKGNLKVAFERSMLVEVDELSENFNSMVETINRLLREIEIANKNERDAELKALQAQINPHFLYNTLDIIHWMTDSPEISNIINNLGKFFRLSLSGGRSVILVQEEIEQVRAYMNIQNIRFKSKFTFIEEIDSKVHEYSMLKLILQPLVENSLLHGLKYMKTGGIIKLYCRMEDDKLAFYIEDNGTGVDIERINYILEGNENKSGYGIKNVNERIKLKYGQQYGLYYSNLEGEGTRVKVIIPIIAVSKSQE